MRLRHDWRIAIVLGAAVSTARVVSSIAAAPNQVSATGTIWSGVFSADQAKRGEVSASSKCAKCHGADLAGGQDGPSLVGPDVLQAWSGMTVGDLFDRVKTTMPADAPRSLSPQETADVVAYLFSLNKCPAGEKEMASEMEALGQIRITTRDASR